MAESRLTEVPGSPEEVPAAPRRDNKGEPIPEDAHLLDVEGPGAPELERIEAPLEPLAEPEEAPAEESSAEPDTGSKAKRRSSKT